MKPSAKWIRLGHKCTSESRAFPTRVSGVRFARAVAAAHVVAGRHHHAVGTVAAEVGEGAHRRRVVAQHHLCAVRGPGLVQLRPPRSRPRDLQGVGAHRRDRHALWTAGH